MHAPAHFPLKRAMSHHVRVRPPSIRLGTLPRCHDASCAYHIRLYVNGMHSLMVYPMTMHNNARICAFPPYTSDESSRTRTVNFHQTRYYTQMLWCFVRIPHEVICIWNARSDDVLGVSTPTSYSLRIYQRWVITYAYVRAYQTPIRWQTRRGCSDASYQYNMGSFKWHMPALMVGWVVTS